MADEDEQNGFTIWLRDFCKSFSNLSDREKNIALEQLIKQCGPEQLRFLSTKLEILVKRDFLDRLPLELSFQIVKRLDARTLCTCCLVSKTWSKVIDNCHDVWQRACAELGMVIRDQELDREIQWKDVYVRGVRRVRSLQGIDAFEVSYLYGHTARVFALCYRDNLLATGSDDRSVRLWDLQSGHCLHVLSTHTCADILFDSNKVLTASFDNTIGLWDWKSGEQLQCFHGHTGAVFCVDFSDELDIIVSGSADTSVKVWGLSSGECHMTRYGHSDWVTKVILHKSEVSSCTHKKGDYVLLSMDKKSIKVWSLDKGAYTPCTTLLPVDEQTSLHPRLQFDGHYITCASEAGVHLWNFENLQLTRLFNDSPAKWLVEHGKMFSLLLDNNNSLHIMNSTNQQTITSFPLPPIRRSARGSNFTPGYSDWLNNINAEMPDKLVFATSMPDHSILLLKLKDVT